MPTVGETDPQFMDKVEALSREHGITVATVAGTRQAFGIEGDLLDAVAPPISVSFTPAGSDESIPVEIERQYIQD